MPGSYRASSGSRKQKTQVVLVDAMDEANGMSTSMPYNQMILFLTQPMGEPGFGTTPYDDWMRLLITHEYTHSSARHGQRRPGGRHPARSSAGLYFPNVLQPIG